MMGALVRRLLRGVALMAGVAIFAFALPALAPGTGDPGERLDAGYSRAANAAKLARHHLDEPFASRLIRWTASIARGDLGTSVEYETPVARLLRARAGPTLLLGLVSTVVSWALAVPLGVWMAARAGRWFDRTVRTAVSTVMAVPEPALALALALFGARTGWVPAGGMRSPRLDPSAGIWQVTIDVAWHMAVPVAVLVAGLLPMLLRHVRASMLEVLESGYVTAARARGVPPARLLFRSALRAAALPLVALFGLSLANLLSASLLVEVIVGWPGLGPLLVEATRAKDVPVVAGVTLCSAAFLVIGGLVADLALVWCDPRVRLAPAPGAERSAR